MDECRAKLLEHVANGDPRDVAAYCAFLWHHGERTAAQPEPASADAEDAARYRAFFAAGLPITFLGVDYYDKPSLDAAIDIARAAKSGEGHGPVDRDVRC
jgi:hypothetical protein